MKKELKKAKAIANKMHAKRPNIYKFLIDKGVDTAIADAAAEFLSEQLYAKPYNDLVNEMEFAQQRIMRMNNKFLRRTENLYEKFIKIVEG